MRSFFTLLLVAGVHALAAASASAEEVSPAQELRELRQVVQMQTKQIELLAEQVSRLTRALYAQHPPELAPSAPTTTLEPVKLSPEPVPEAPKAEAIPKAEAVPAGAKHVVAKGETLTSIAKQYNIPIADLKNANKIENERKLQIGHVLTVPAIKTPETPDKKENP